MADDPSVKWQLANPFGILINKDANAWHSGHVNDVLVFPDLTALVVGTESGGVWLIDAASDPLPLSTTWDIPDMSCRNDFSNLQPKAPAHAVRLLPTGMQNPTGLGSE